MAPREPTNTQLSSRLSYQAQKPAFLQKFQNKLAGLPDDEDDEEEEFEYGGEGREPIPRRPRAPIPERPAEDPGSADEDDMDEKPQVVVLKEGKHLTEWEAENVRRKEKGLPPLLDPHVAKEDTSVPDSSVGTSSKTDIPGSKQAGQGLSFSSNSNTSFGNKPSKRKAINQPDEEKDDKSTSKKKKPKKEKKTLLSFGDDA